MKSIFRLNKGISLIEVLVSVGIMSILALAMTTMISNQSKEIKALEEKYTAVDVKNQLEKLLSSPTYCGCLMAGKTFNEISKQWSALPNSFSKSYSALPAPCTAVGGPLITVGSQIAGSQVIVSGLTVVGANETVVGSGSYTSKMKISLQNTVRPIKDIEINFNFSVAGGVPTARNLLGCGASAGGMVSLNNCYQSGFSCNPMCAAGEVLTRVELCSFAHNPGCGVEDCGGGGNDYDMPTYRITCCKLSY